MKLAITKKPMSIAWTMSSRLFCTNPILPELDELQVNQCRFLFPATIFFLFSCRRLRVKGGIHNSIFVNMPMVRALFA